MSSKVVRLTCSLVLLASVLLLFLGGLEPAQSQQMTPEIFQTTSYTTSYTTNYATTTLTSTQTFLHRSTSTIYTFTFYTTTKYGPSCCPLTFVPLVVLEGANVPASTATTISRTSLTLEQVFTTAHTLSTTSSTVLFTFGIAETIVVGVLVAIVVVALFLFRRMKRNPGKV